MAEKNAGMRSSLSADGELLFIYKLNVKLIYVLGFALCILYASYLALFLILHWC